MTLILSLPVACGRYEVYTAVHPGVWDPLLPVYVDFLLQVGFILVIDELHYGLPADKENADQEGIYRRFDYVAMGYAIHSKFYNCYSFS